MIDLSNLEAKARAATQGEWRAEQSSSDDEWMIVGEPSWPCIRRGVKGEWNVAYLDDMMGEHDKEVAANAAYIVAAQPSVVMELIERIRAAEAKAGKPVAWLIEHPREGKSVELAHLGTRPLYPDDEEAGYTASPLYAAPVDTAALQERVRELEDALRPFVIGSAELEHLLWGHLPDDAQGTTTTNLGYYRRARKALGGSNE